MRNVRAVSAFGLACCFVASLGSPAYAYRVRLAWRAVPDAAGYTIYVRRNGSPDFVAIDAGRPTPDADGILHAEQSGLLVESTQTFALTSYDAARKESTRSNEISIGYAKAATVVDTDGDRLTDAREDVDLNTVRGAGETDRQRADTDADGFADGVEVALGTDPTSASSRPVPTATRTTTPVRTATPTVVPTRTATPVRSSTPLPTRTATPVPTATATPAASATGTPRPTSTPRDTPVPPTATATRAPSPMVTTPPPRPTATPLPVGVLPVPTILDVERVD